MQKMPLNPTVAGIGDGAAAAANPGSRATRASAAGWFGIATARTP